MIPLLQGDCFFAATVQWSMEQGIDTRKLRKLTYKMLRRSSSYVRPNLKSRSWLRHELHSAALWCTRSRAKCQHCHTGWRQGKVVVLARALRFNWTKRKSKRLPCLLDSPPPTVVTWKNATQLHQERRRAVLPTKCECQRWLAMSLTSNSPRRGRAAFRTSGSRYESFLPRQYIW